MAIKYYKLLLMLNKQGISKGELQAMIGASSTTIAKIAKHEPISVSTIDSICRALHCQPGDIMEYVDDDN